MVTINRKEIKAWAIMTALGRSSEEYWPKIISGKPALELISDEKYGTTPFWGSRLPEIWYQNPNLQKMGFTRFEQLCATGISCFLKENPKLEISTETLFVLSSTKGNVEDLEQGDVNSITLAASAQKLAGYFCLRKPAIVVSQACVSGVMALHYAQMMLSLGRCKSALICGADLLSAFVVHGFLSLKALSDMSCKPFDRDRKGLNLGEGLACVWMENSTVDSEYVLSAAYSSNDANHISSPSRTGAELAKCIQEVLEKSHLEAQDIDMVSAHGTATVFNDEMEAKAMAISGLETCSVHSFKGYIGHTLGAAGLIETVVSLEALKKQTLIPSPGFLTADPDLKLNVCRQAETQKLQHVIKTASGFGGVNAALLISRQ